MDFFKVIKSDKKTNARTGIISTPHGNIATPVYMPVGTKATVKAVTQHQLYEMNCKIILANLYHLYLQPGIEIIEKAGGLHKFMNWERNILTDSGGFQVFSLSNIRKVTDEGVEFKSIIDGSTHFFSPEEVIRMQTRLGSDILMVLDECISFNENYRYTMEAAERTIKWAEISLKTRDTINRERNDEEKIRVFGIIQGGFIKEIRKFCAETISGMNFSGTAIGGLSVGEQRGITMDILSYTIEYIDKSKPVYFMGLGDPEGVIDAISEGVDMFDCVMPTRISRNGSAFTSYGKINIKNKKYSEDFTPLDEKCGCYTCRNYSKSYLKHLYKSGEILSSILMSIHNLKFMFDLVDNARKFIEKDEFTSFKKDFKQNYNKNKN
jgi:queuine tRNA-ribosyltransferase